jgi:hypothetical protein
MKKREQLSLTEKSLRALRAAVAKAADEHARRGIPMAVWRNGKAVSVPAGPVAVLRETTAAYRTKSHGRKP